MRVSCQPYAHRISRDRSHLYHRHPRQLPSSIMTPVSYSIFVTYSYLYACCLTHVPENNYVLEDKLRNIGNEKGKRIWRELREMGLGVLGRESNFIILHYFKNLTVLTVTLCVFVFIVCLLFKSRTGAD